MYCMQLAGNFVKNTRIVAICIGTSDIKLSLSADIVSTYATHINTCIYFGFMLISFFKYC